MMAIVFAVVSSFNSVGVSVYQEQLFKVKRKQKRKFLSIDTVMSCCQYYQILIITLEMFSVINL